MKKSFFVAALVLLSFLPSLAQNPIVNNPANKAYFGIRVAPEVTCPGMITDDGIGIKAFKNGGGIEFGGIYNIPVVANFYIEPGLKLFYNTFSLKDTFVDSVEDDMIFDSVSFKKFGMRIPVMLGYHFDFTSDVKVSLFTGPELEIAFSGKEYIKGKNIEMSGSIYGDEGDMKRTNLLWGIGAGVTYRRFYFGVSGGIGMLNMLDDDDFKFHENRVTFSLGYNF